MKKRKATVRYAGFRVPYDQRLGYTLQGDTSPNMFSQYVREARLLFEHASKVVLLTGEPRSEKTSMLMNLLANLDSESRALVYFALSRPILSRNKCMGFEVVTSGNSTPRSFATRQNDGSYSVDLTVWATVATELQAAQKERKIIILDEIGPMQLQSPDLLHTVEAIINDPLATLFATIPLEDGTNAALRKLKQHYRSTILTLPLSKPAKAEVEQHLEQELRGSIYVATRIPQTLFEAF
jgi:nucleoside-triphosphatase THEP1